MDNLNITIGQFAILLLCFLGLLFSIWFRSRNTIKTIKNQKEEDINILNIRSIGNGWLLLSEVYGKRYFMFIGKDGNGFVIDSFNKESWIKDKTGYSLGEK